MKKLLLVGLAAVCGPLVVVVFRASTLESRQPPAATPVEVPIQAEGMAERLAGAIRFETISLDPPALPNAEVFLGLHSYLAATYPRLHERLEREAINELSLLFTWPGTEPELPPVVLMGHMDVVPVIPGTEADWTHPPFDGVVADGFIWGRGTLDNKNGVIAILEAVEHLVAEGFQPRRSVYLALGHDEEIGGVNGAQEIVRILESRGVNEYALVLDEGAGMVDGTEAGIEGPVALFGTAEKGFVSLDLTVRGEGGHSSMPPFQTNIGILAEAIRKIEEDQFPARLESVMEQTLAYIGPELGFVPRAVLANLWLTRPALVYFMASDRIGSAFVRTTTAVTMIDGGVKSNVLPIEAHATANHRILPGETIESVRARVAEVIDDDRVEVAVRRGFERGPSLVSDPEGPAFQLLAKTLSQVVADPALVVAPFLVVGGTDSQYYSARSRNVFRFFAGHMKQTDAARMHGTDERLAIDNLVLGARFLYQLIRNTDEL